VVVFPVDVLLVGLSREMAGDELVATHVSGAFRISGYGITRPGQQIARWTQAVPYDRRETVSSSGMRKDWTDWQETADFDQRWP
jgi:hypothetical protein